MINAVKVGNKVNITTTQDDDVDGALGNVTGVSETGIALTLLTHWMTLGSWIKAGDTILVPWGSITFVHIINS